MEIRLGDVVEVPSNKVEQAPRRGTVEAVLAQDPLKVEIRWEDGHRSQLNPRVGSLRVTGHVDG